MPAYSPGLKIPEPAYLDANFIISVLARSPGRSSASPRAYADLISQKVTLFVSLLTIDEVWWGLLRELNDAEERPLKKFEFKKNPGKFLAPHIIAQIRTATGALMQWPRLRLLFAPSARVAALIRVPLLTQRNKWRLLDETVSVMQVGCLGPRDAFHLRLARGAGALSFITEDADFGAVPASVLAGLTVIKV